MNPREQAIHQRCVSTWTLYCAASPVITVRFIRACPASFERRGRQTNNPRHQQQQRRVLTDVTILPNVARKKKKGESEQTPHTQQARARVCRSCTGHLTDHHLVILPTVPHFLKSWGRDLRKFIDDFPVGEQHDCTDPQADRQTLDTRLRSNQQRNAHDCKIVLSCPWCPILTAP